MNLASLRVRLYAFFFLCLGRRGPIADSATREGVLVQNGRNKDAFRTKLID